MVGLTTASLNLAVDAWASTVTQVSLHTGDPGPTGVNNECTGGSPAYARKSLTFAAASGGTATASSTPVFDVPAGTYTHVGYWAGATFRGSRLCTSQTFTGQGTYTLTPAATESAT